MIRGFKSSRIREEFANFAAFAPDAKSGCLQFFFPRRSVLRTPLAFDVLRLPSTKGDIKFMKPIPGTLQEGGAAFQSTHWTLVLRARQSDPTETAREGAFRFL